MLSQLFIDNLAIIKKAEISLEKGFNVFTGETGAGKSIVIGAISAVIGGRMNKDIIRFGEEKGIVSAVFTELDDEIINFLCELGYECEKGDDLLISREVHPDKTKCRINGQPATVAMLKKIGDRLLHIHGQHDNQQLFSADYHRELIDEYSEVGDELLKYGEVYKQYLEADNNLNDMLLDNKSRNERIDLLTFQINELREADLKEGEEEILMQRRAAIGNVSKLTRLLGSAAEKLAGSPGIDELISELAHELSQLEEYLPNLSGAREVVDSFSDELRWIISDVTRAADSLEFDPDELDDIERRLDVMYRLKNKYGKSVNELISYYEVITEEHDRISNFEENLAKLKARKQELEAKTKKLAEQISKKRKAGAKKFCSKIVEELSELDMVGAMLEAKFEEKELSSNGADKVEFLISTNRGEKPKPISKIASGGEMSRLMLSIRAVLDNSEGSVTSIFDEVDSGVSGRAAQKIGRKLQKASKNQQILCVTHLSQVACFSDNHLLIHKFNVDDSTMTEIKPLNFEERISEIARINSGEDITELSLSTAREMLELNKRKD